MSKRYAAVIESETGGSVEIVYATKWDAGRVAQAIKQLLKDIPPSEVVEVYGHYMLAGLSIDEAAQGATDEIIRELERQPDAGEGWC